MSIVKELPIILLVFSNETKTLADGKENARYLKELVAEKLAIEKAIEEANKTLDSPLCQLVSLEGKDANLQNIFDLFNRNPKRIIGFHFAGHADGYQLVLQDPEKGQSNIAHAGGLVSFFKQKGNLQFIFLNGCETYRQALDIHEQGIPTVIGSRHKIDDEEARDFAHRFYRSLAQGVSLEHAWQDACSILQTFQKNGVLRNSNRSLVFETAETDTTSLSRLSWELFTSAPEWNLGSAAKNPLHGLPEPFIERRPKLKKNAKEPPYRYLEPYDQYSSHLFFGRGKEIRRLFSLLISREHSPLILFYGQSGVGKSSVLDAGLFPRIKSRESELKNKVVYFRRNEQVGLLEGLKQSLRPLLPAKFKGKDVREMIEAILASIPEPTESDNPFFNLPPLIILMDQVEETFTRPLNDKAIDNRAEWSSLLNAIEPILHHPVLKAKVKWMLSFRKEYFPEIRNFCQNYQFSWEDVFLKPLDEQGIHEVIYGIQSTPDLRETYGISVEETAEGENSFVYSITEDLLSDKHSAISPILQIQLSEMWERVAQKKPGNRMFTFDAYQTIKQEGAKNLENFFWQQLQELRLGASEDLKQLIDAGLALDLLEAHTTEMGTATQNSFEEIKKRYVLSKSERKKDHFSAYSEEKEKSPKRIPLPLLEGLLKELVNVKLLLKTDAGITRLAHDTLAPYVLKAFSNSNLPGQQAARLLSTKIQFLRQNEQEQQTFETKQEEKLPARSLKERAVRLIEAKSDDSDPLLLEPANLRIIQEGLVGMRKLTRQEQEIVGHNLEKQEKVVSGRQKGRIIGLAFGLLIAIVAFWGLRNLASMVEQSRQLHAYHFLDQADQKLEEQQFDDATYLASQAYLYNFPNSPDHILRRMEEIQENLPADKQLLSRIRTLESPLEHVVLSPNGKTVLQWSEHKAILTSLISGKTIKLKENESQKIHCAQFSTDAYRIAFGLSNQAGKKGVWIVDLKSEEDYSLSLDATPNCISIQGDALVVGQLNRQLILWEDFKQRDERKILDFGADEDEYFAAHVNFDPTGAMIIASLYNLNEEYWQKFLWRKSNNGWENKGASFTGTIGGFSPDQSNFLLSDGRSVIRWQYDRNEIKELEPSITLRGRAISSSQFTAQGDILIHTDEDRLWVFDPTGKPKDVFELPDSIVSYQAVLGGEEILFYTHSHNIYRAPLGRSISQWAGSQLEGEDFVQKGQPPHLSFSEEVNSWLNKLERLFFFLKLVTILAYINFMIHFIASLGVWDDWMESLDGLFFGFEVDGTTIVAIGITVTFFFFMTIWSDGTADLVGMLALCGLFSVYFNVRKMWLNFQEHNYLAFYAWLLLFLGWLGIFGRVAFEIDKYGLFTAQDTMDLLESIGWSFLLLIAFVFIFQRGKNVLFN